MADGYGPGVVFKSDVENELGCHSVNGRVVDPAFDGEGKGGKPEVGARGKEDMGDDAVASSFPFWDWSAVVGMGYGGKTVP